MGLFPEYVAKSGKDVTEDTVELDFDFPEVSKVDKQEFIKAVTEILKTKKDVFNAYKGISGYGCWKIRPETMYFGRMFSPKGLERQKLEAAAYNAMGGKSLFSADCFLWEEAFEYDENGNRINKTNGWGEINYEYNAENELLKAGNREYGYDLNGNLIEEKLGKVGTSYSYNAENRIEEVNTQVKGMIGHWNGWCVRPLAAVVL